MRKKKIRLSAAVLKLIAIIAMTVDHCAYAFVSPDSLLYFVMRFAGRMTAPIMSSFIAEGFVHTKSRKKYLARLLMFAVISQPFYIVFYLNRVPKNFFEFVSSLNVMFTLALSLISLMILTEKKLHITVKIILFGVCLMLSDMCDWTYIIPVWTVIFYFFREEKTKRNILFVTAAVVLPIIRYLPFYDDPKDYLFMLGAAFAIIPISLYSGQLGKGSKITRLGFYIYYPLHLILIIFIKFFSG